MRHVRSGDECLVDTLLGSDKNRRIHFLQATKQQFYVQCDDMCRSQFPQGMLGKINNSLSENSTNMWAPIILKSDYQIDCRHMHPPTISVTVNHKFDSRVEECEHVKFLFVL